MTVGFSFIALLGVGPLGLGSVTFDIHTMLFGSMLMIVGLQAICFAVFAKCIAAAQMRNRVTHKRFLHVLKVFTLERGLLLGLVLILIGAGGVGYGFLFWKSHSFGTLAPTQMMRLLIPSITAFILGAQLIFSSFFMSVLNLHYPYEEVTPDLLHLTGQSNTI
jgi:hypothetical protein